MKKWPLVVVVGFIAWLVTPIHSQAREQSHAIRNILFIVADDLRASVLGCYGDPLCKTPNIDRLAKSGMTFQHAYCQGTWCAPSRKSFMYSRYVDQQGPNLGEHFRAAGWYTARVGKIYHMRVPGDIIAGTNGLDVASSWTERFNAPGREAHTPGDYACLNQNIFTRSFLNRESTRMPNRPFVYVISDSDGSDQPDFKAATKAIEILSRKQDEQFLLAVGLVRPHYPMVAPRDFFEDYPHDKIDLPPQLEGDTDDIPLLGKTGTTNANNSIGRYPENQKRMWSAYYASVAFMDAQVGRILDALERLGLRDSTAIVFTSDHGYHLGDHGFWQKSNLHEQVVRVPLICSVPGFPSGTTRSLVELVDIYPTACELAGITIPDTVQGVSLLPVLKSPQARVRDTALSINKGYSLRTDAMHYIRYQDGTGELYDMKTDPHQLVNLFDAQDRRREQSQLDDILQLRLQDAGLVAVDVD